MKGLGVVPVPGGLIFFAPEVLPVEQARQLQVFLNGRHPGVIVTLISGTTLATEQEMPEAVSAFGSAVQGMGQAIAELAGRVGELEAYIEAEQSYRRDQMRLP